MPTNQEVDYSRAWPNNLLPEWILPDRKNGLRPLPPTYYGPPRQVLPPLPRNLTELRTGHYAWWGSMPARHSNFAFYGLMMGGISRLYSSRSFFPFRRGIRPWGVFAVYIGLMLSFDFWLLNVHDSSKARLGMRLEMLRRMRAKSLQEIRFEAQRSLEQMSDAEKAALELSAAL